MIKNFVSTDSWTFNLMKKIFQELKKLCKNYGYCEKQIPEKFKSILIKKLIIL